MEFGFFDLYFGVVVKNGKFVGVICMDGGVVVGDYGIFYGVFVFVDDCFVKLVLGILFG